MNLTQIRTLQNFPEQLRSVRTKKDIETACKILLTNAVQNWELIDEPTLRLMPYASGGNWIHPSYRSTKYPLWEQKIMLTLNNGVTTDYRLSFHEIDQSLRIYNHVSFNCPSYNFMVAERFVGRKFAVSANKKRVTTIYDDGFLATPKQAAQKLLEEVNHFCWKGIVSIEPKIIYGCQAVWLITYGYSDWKYALDIVGNPLNQFQYHMANVWKSVIYDVKAPIKPYDDLQDPIIGQDYFAFDWHKKSVHEVSGLIAVRFNGSGFFPVPLRKAKIPLPNLTNEKGEKQLIYL